MSGSWELAGGEEAYFCVYATVPEDIYIKGYETVPGLTMGLGDYFPFYNEERQHQSLGYQTPAEVYLSGRRAG